MLQYRDSLHVCVCVCVCVFQRETLEVLTKRVPSRDNSVTILREEWVDLVLVEQRESRAQLTNVMEDLLVQVVTAIALRTSSR